MRKILLYVAYDGTNYNGWQLQPNGVTIEEMLNRELSRLFGEPIEVLGASRTDSGVHSLGSVAVFVTNARMPADRICIALNQRLPEDIRAVRSVEVPMAFHPRKINGVKTYEYRILNRRVNDPTRRLYSYFCYYALDIGKMQKAASYLIGEHDFASFCTVKTQAVTTVRTIYDLTVTRSDDDMVTIRVSGSGFLYNMVRIIAGTLLRVGTGLYPPEHVKEILEARSRKSAGPTAPAQGLTMVSLEYEKRPPAHLQAENEHYRYEIDQSELAAEAAGSSDEIFLPALASGKAVSRIRILRSEDSEFAGLAERLIHEAYRNGAGRVLIRDMEGSRIKTGERFGLYRIDGEDTAGKSWFSAVFCGKTG